MFSLLVRQLLFEFVYSSIAGDQPGTRPGLKCMGTKLRLWLASFDCRTEKL